MKKLAVFSSLFIAINAHAALYDRGNGMIYDSTQNITWLQDANYAKTSGYDADSRMTPTEAGAWADQLIYAGYSDWRLSSARLLNPNDTNPCNTYDGSCDRGYNISRSELGHLFYVDLGNIGTYSPSGQLNTGYPLLKTNFTDASSGSLVSFLNLQSFQYYWQQETAVWSNGGAGWVFNTGSGEQSVMASNYEFRAWAVRDGDVAAVPGPAAAWLFGSGLAGLFGAARKRKMR